MLKRQWEAAITDFSRSNFHLLKDYLSPSPRNLCDLFMQIGCLSLTLETKAEFPHLLIWIISFPVLTVDSS